MSNQTDSIQKLLSSGLKSKYPSAQQSSISGLLNTSSLAATANTLTKVAQSAISALMGKTSATSNATLASLTSSFPSQSALFSNVNANSKSLSSISEDKKYGTKETDSKMKTLSSGSDGAISQPISFITKPINDVIKGTDTTVAGKRKQNLLSDMDSDEIDKLQNGAGFNITTSSDVTKAVQQVTNKIASQFGQSSGFSARSSNLGGGSNSLLSSIAKTLGSISGSPTISSYLQSGAKMATSAYNALPTSMKRQIASNSNSVLATAASALLSDRSTSYTNILGKLGGTSYADSLASRTLALNNSYRYDGVMTPSGAPLIGYGSGNSADIDGLYGAALSICPGVKRADYQQYRQNKDMYDILMQLAAEGGMSDLMRQLSQCSESGTYYDNRTSGILQSSSRQVAYNGDAQTYLELTKILGAQNVNNSSRNVIILNSNMPGNSTNIAAYNSILRSNGYTTQDLVSRDHYGRTAYSGNRVTMMSASNTSILDEAIGAGVRTLITGAFSAYS